MTFPPPPFSHAQSPSSTAGSTLKSLVRDYVERGLREPAPPAAVAAPDRSREDQLDPFTKGVLGLALTKARNAGATRLCATSVTTLHYFLRKNDALGEAGGVHTIVTRNKSAFAPSPVPALTPEEYLSQP